MLWWIIIGVTVYLLVGAFWGSFLATLIERDNAFVVILLLWPIVLVATIGIVLARKITKGAKDDE